MNSVLISGAPDLAVCFLTTISYLQSSAAEAPFLLLKGNEIRNNQRNDDPFLSPSLAVMVESVQLATATAAVIQQRDNKQLKIYFSFIISLYFFIRSSNNQKSEFAIEGAEEPHREAQMERATRFSALCL